MTLALVDPDAPLGTLPADRTSSGPSNAHGDHALGVYANVAAPGSFAEGDPLELEPSAGASAPAALARTGAATSSAPP